MDQPTRLTEKQKLDVRDKVLDDFEKKLGLPKNIVPGSEEELQGYLTMDRTEIEAYSSDELRSISIRLAQYSIYIQRVVNRCKAIFAWSSSEFYKITANDMLQFNGDKFLPKETKLALVAKKNLSARELEDINLYAQQTIDRLNELASGIKNLSYIISLSANGKKHE